jgi:hypothetical protein
MCRLPVKDAVWSSAKVPQVSATPRLVLHPAFPRLPSSVPLAYTLTMTYCLAHAPSVRPTFAQMETLFSEMVAEVKEGHYADSCGKLQVCIHSPLCLLSTHVWLPCTCRGRHLDEKVVKDCTTVLLIVLFAFWFFSVESDVSRQGRQC